MDKEILVLTRCPSLSDGCKLTLITWVYYAREHDRYPSLQETANLRGCRRSTIQLHLEEGLNKEFLSKQSHGSVAVYHIHWERFALDLGYSNWSMVDEHQLVGLPTPKKTTPAEMQLRAMPRAEIKSSRQLLLYFKALYREKIGEEYNKPKNPDVNKCRTLIKEYGAATAVSMIDFFMKHRGRLCLGETSIETIFKNREHIYAKASGS